MGTAARLLEITRVEPGKMRTAQGAMYTVALQGLHRLQLGEVDTASAPYFSTFAARDASRVVVGDVLLGRPGHSVVVLRDGHGLGEGPERAFPRHRAVGAGLLKADDRREGLGGSKPS